MKPSLALLVAVIGCTFGATACRADGVLIGWGGRDVVGASQTAFDEAKKVVAADIPDKNLKVRRWLDVYLLVPAVQLHKADGGLQDKLIEQLTDRTEIELADTSRLIIWERITSGDILFEGKGLQVEDDLFSVAGRANWLLRQMTSKNFGHVKPDSTDKDLSSLQATWKKWRAGEDVAEYRPPFITKKGLDEIKSRAALQALIASLKPSEAKDKLTKSALKKLYQLDKLPDDPNSPAMLCNPDTYTNQYLTKLTGIQEPHDHAWWLKWWTTNEARLYWNTEKDCFEVKTDSIPK